MITIEDLIKYGMARDIEPIRKQSLAERNAVYDRQVDLYTRIYDRDINALQVAGKGQTSQASSLTKAYEQNLAKIEKDREASIGRLESRFQEEADRYKSNLQNPVVIKQVGDLKLKEIRDQAEAVRAQTETLQREGAERQASSVRARMGRVRGDRQMLSSARLSPEVGIGGKSTLGVSPF